MGYMPLMIELKKVAVFGGERGEGLQKTQKLSYFAEEVVVVPEAEPAVTHLVFPAGPLSQVKENLVLKAPQTAAVHPRRAELWTDEELTALIQDCSFVVSDLVDPSLNERISRLCADRGKICTVVDTKPLSTAWFMSLAVSGNLTAAVSSGGRIAFYAARVREELQGNLDRLSAQAPVWEKLRNSLVPDQRLPGLEFLWHQPRFRRKISSVSPEKAYNAGIKKLKNAGFLTQDPDHKEPL